MVVFIHALFYGKIGIAVDALARFAVPLFFLVSGYYSYNMPPKKISRRIVHLIKLLVFAVLVYTVYDTLQLFLTQDIFGIGQYFSRYRNPKSLKLLLLFNIPVHTEHLWYLFALIYVYLVFCFSAICRIPDKLIAAASIALLILHLFLGEFLSFVDIPVPRHIVRNFLLMGIPFFGLGLLAKKHRHKLVKLPDWIIIITAIIGVLETVLSRLSFVENEIYVGSLFLLFSLTVVFIKYPDMEFPPILVTLSECSTYIYILHPMVLSVLEDLYAALGMNRSSVTFQMVHPLVVCVFSTVIAYAVIQLTKKRKRTWAVTQPPNE